ncbi:MAG: potassium transporter, partial [Muribaculaceae bacterium]|nr:potassium transporter [Muribaculaceae bacterium]
GMSLWDKSVQSIFNALAPRSAGFASVNPASFLPATLLLVVVQMWIGGASQSMAGGIKVNTMAVVILNLRSVVHGHQGIPAWNRSIAIPSVRRANAVVVLSILSFTAYALAILVLEPALSVKALLFEVVSALFTVGSSLGITGDLCDGSKVLLSTAMFVGRVGILSLLMGVLPHRRDASQHYPQDSVIIN